MPWERMGRESGKAFGDKPFAMGHEAGGKQGGPEPWEEEAWVCMRKYKQVRFVLAGGWAPDGRTWDPLSKAMEGIFLPRKLWAPGMWGVLGVPEK